MEKTRHFGALPFALQDSTMAVWRTFDNGGGIFTDLSIDNSASTSLSKKFLREDNLVNYFLIMTCEERCMKAERITLSTIMTIYTLNKYFFTLISTVRS